jgi:phospholipid transport system substrate-binding protein
VVGDSLTAGDKIGSDMTCRLASAALAASLLAAPGSSAWAGPPTEQLRARIDRVVKVLEEPALKKDAKTTERRVTLRGIANEIFDFAEISQRSLGRHWQTRTPPEREEFVALFGDLLERTYFAKIESYSGERVVFAGEMVDGDQATVRTRIITKQRTEVPVDYRMFQRDGRWQVFDVNIEGVSLVSNYRTQFNAIIVRSSYQDLVAKLKAKQDEGAGPRDTGRHRVESP